MFSNGEFAWIKDWFLEIHKWNKSRVIPPSRLIWLNCYGVPLHLWNAGTFIKLGQIWGNVIQTSDDTVKGISFAVGKVLISTRYMDMINKVVFVENKGVKFQVRICEEQVVVNTIINNDCKCKGCYEEDADMEEVVGRVEQMADIDKSQYSHVEDTLKTMAENSMEIVNETVETPKELSMQVGNCILGDSSCSPLRSPITSQAVGGVNALENLGSLQINENIITASKEEDEGRKMRNKEEVDLGNNDLASTTDETNDVVEDTEVVDESPSSLIDNMAAAKNKLQLVVFKPPSWRWFFLEQSENVVGSAKVVSPIINDIQISNIPNSQISTNDITSSKINNLVENNFSESDQFSSWSELSFNRKLAGPSKKKVAAEKLKKRKKSIEELIGIPKIKRGGRKSKKGTLVRSAIASAALSISSEGIRNRNRIILDEEEAARTISNIIGEEYLGIDEEVISKFMVTNS